ncbi:MAG: preprotein translocase subunit YajC [Fibrobacter sp.]|nr:preprotein translocase subunit YajC [Fibrobacter sp.]
MQIWITSALISLATVFSLAAQEAAPAAQQPGGLGSLLPMMLVMFAIIYFLMIRPEQKKQKQRQEMMAGLKKGDKVLTAGGILGSVANVKDEVVMVKVAENTVIELTKSAVTSVIDKETAANKVVKEEKSK